MAGSHATKSAAAAKPKAKSTRKAQAAPPEAPEGEQDAAAPVTPQTGPALAPAGPPAAAAVPAAPAVLRIAPAQVPAAPAVPRAAPTVGSIAPAPRAPPQVADPQAQMKALRDLGTAYQSTTERQRAMIQLIDVAAPGLGLGRMVQAALGAVPQTAAPAAATTAVVPPPQLVRVSAPPAPAQAPAARTPVAGLLEPRHNQSMAAPWMPAASLPRVPQHHSTVEEGGAQQQAVARDAHFPMIAPDAVVAQHASAPTTKAYKPLPDPIVGFRADPFEKPVPPNVSRRIRDGEFVPLTCLTYEGRQYAYSRGSRLELKSDMTFQEASFNANDDRGMPQSAWSGAFNVLVREIEKYHGVFRASRYRMHKEICDGLLGRWGDWHTVLEYDIAQREAAVADPRHDLGHINNDAMTGIMADPAWCRLHFAAPATPAPTAAAKRTAPVSGPDRVPCPALRLALHPTSRQICVLAHAQMNQDDPAYVRK